MDSMCLRGICVHKHILLSAAFHHGLYSLPKYPFSGLQYTKGLCSFLSVQLHLHLALSIRPCQIHVLLDFSLTVKAATLIFISGCGSAISSAKEGKSGIIYNLVKS